MKFRHSLFAVAASLMLAGMASAVPIVFEIQSHGSVPGFGFSLMHECATTSCMSGSSLGRLSGSLDGHLEDGMLLGLTGDVYIGGATNQTFAVTGSFDFTPGGSGGTLLFAGLGEFEFANQIISGPANSFDGTQLYAWGGIAGPQGAGYVAGIDIAGSVAAVPEPSAALLFGIGTLVVGAGTRRR